MVTCDGQGSMRLLVSAVYWIRVYKYLRQVNDDLNFSFQTIAEKEAPCFYRRVKSSFSK